MSLILVLLFSFENNHHKETHPKIFYNTFQFLNALISVESVSCKCWQYISILLFIILFWIWIGSVLENSFVIGKKNLIGKWSEISLLKIAVLKSNFTKQFVLNMFNCGGALPGDSCWHNNCWYYTIFVYEIWKFLNFIKILVIKEIHS